MKKVFLALVALGLMAWCYFQFKDLAQRNNQQTQEANVPFEYEVDRFADIRILRYKLALHEEVLRRSETLNIPPYNGFVNPILEPVKDKKGNIVDVKVTYAKSFSEQMLNYSKNFGFLAPKK
ncbi:MAG: hypothetical protein FJX90_08760 [Bacteroidetes bacterium]|nr:hypothetical protein [Bacteroidota bacterium]